jgi:hypothetical protein
MRRVYYMPPEPEPSLRSKCRKIAGAAAEIGVLLFIFLSAALGFIVL